MAVEITDKTIVIAGGGTGGHLFPGIAVAEAILARRPGTTILIVGTGRPVETKALAGKPYAYRVLGTPRLERSLNPLNLLLPFRFAAAIWRAGRLLDEFQARLVIGTGGYGSAPVVAAARFKHIPAVILEQNIIPGLTNRLVSRLADLACLAFEPSRALLAPRVRAVVTGNPIRKIVDRNNGRSARTGLGLKPDRFTVFVFGGSQGAKRLVEAAAAALPLLAAEDMQLIVQTGPNVKLETPPEWSVAPAAAWRKSSLSASP
jgi:UDP-N-acetylglucosamine--N-acetylmuramyl-(pentapeptide) pyrophosphoryl-undecaprenol N-acetylglucosamine transferase